MNQPKQPNPALAQPGQQGGYPSPQPGAAQGGFPPGAAPPNQQPPPPQAQTPGQPQGAVPQDFGSRQPGVGSGLVDAGGQPIQPEMTPLRLNPDGVAIPVPSMNPHELAQMLGGQLPLATVFTWVEVSYALSTRDAQIGWLERRLHDIEQKIGLEPIGMEAFLAEMQAEFEAAQAGQAPPQGQPPQGEQPPQGQPPQGQPPQGHGMPGGGQPR